MLFRSSCARHVWMEEENYAPARGSKLLESSTLSEFEPWAKEAGVMDAGKAKPTRITAPRGRNEHNGPLSIDNASDGLGEGVKPWHSSASNFVRGQSIFRGIMRQKSGLFRGRCHHEVDPLRIEKSRLVADGDAMLKIDHSLVPARQAALDRRLVGGVAKI